MVVCVDFMMENWLPIMQRLWPMSSDGVGQDKHCWCCSAWVGGSKTSFLLLTKRSHDVVCGVRCEVAARYTICMRVAVSQADDDYMQRRENTRTHAINKRGYCNPRVRDWKKGTIKSPHCDSIIIDGTADILFTVCVCVLCVRAHLLVDILMFAAQIG